MAYNAANSQNSPLDGMGVTVAEQSANVSLAPDVAFTSLAIGFAIAATEVSRYTALWTTSLVDVPAKYPILIAFLIIGMTAIVMVGRRTAGAPYCSFPTCATIVAASVTGAAARWLCLVGIIPQSAIASVLIGVGLEAPYLLMAISAPLLLRYEPHVAMRTIALGKR